MCIAVDYFSVENRLTGTVTKLIAYCTGTESFDFELWNLLWPSTGLIFVHTGTGNCAVCTRIIPVCYWCTTGTSANILVGYEG